MTTSRTTRTRRRMTTSRTTRTRRRRRAASRSTSRAPSRARRLTRMAWMALPWMTRPWMSADSEDDESADDETAEDDEAAEADYKKLDVRKFKYHDLKTLRMLKKDPDEQFNAFHRRMINGGRRVTKDVLAELEPEEKRKIAEIFALFFIAVFDSVRWFAVFSSVDLLDVPHRQQGVHHH